MKENKLLTKHSFSYFPFSNKENVVDGKSLRTDLMISVNIFFMKRERKRNSFSLKKMSSVSVRIVLFFDPSVRGHVWPS